MFAVLATVAGYATAVDLRVHQGRLRAGAPAPGALLGQVCVDCGHTLSIPAAVGSWVTGP